MTNEELDMKESKHTIITTVILSIAAFVLVQIFASVIFKAISLVKQIDDASARLERLGTYWQDCVNSEAFNNGVPVKVTYPCKIEKR